MPFCEERGNPILQPNCLVATISAFRNFESSWIGNLKIAILKFNADACQFRKGIKGSVRAARTSVVRPYRCAMSSAGDILQMTSTWQRVGCAIAPSF